MPYMLDLTMVSTFLKKPTLPCQGGWNMGRGSGRACAQTRKCQSASRWTKDLGDHLQETDRILKDLSWAYFYKESALTQNLSFFDSLETENQKKNQKFISSQRVHFVTIYNMHLIKKLL
jgi:hypothetical protein